jgi:hypothetical protein
MADDTDRYRETGSNPRAGDTPGFGTGGGGSVGGGGGYGSGGGLLSGGGDNGRDNYGRDASINATEAANRALAEERARQQAYMNFIASQAAGGPRTRGGPASVEADLAQRDAMIKDFITKTIMAESGGIANIKNPLSSATGLGQFTKGTWLDLVDKYRPDLKRDLTQGQILDLRTDPQLSTEMVGNLAKDNAAYLESRNLPVNEGSLYLSHFLGAGTAANVLKSSPDTPISDIVGEDAINANKRILGGDRTAADIAQWASNKMMASVPARGAVQASANEPSVRSGFNPPETGQPSTQPAQTGGFFNQLFGGPAALQTRIADLEAAGRTSTYPTFGNNNPEADWNAGDVKQWYADQFAGGDISKVKSRITDFGEGPVVDYYTKDLAEVPGDIISGLLGGIGKSFGGAGGKPYKGAESDRASSIATGSIFGNLFSGTPRADYGPYGNLTPEQYRQQYGAIGVPQRQAVAALSPAITPASIPAPTPEEMAKDPYLWQQYYNRIPQNYGIEIAQAPLMGPSIRGIFS